MIPNIQAVVNELTPVFLPVREQTAVKQFDALNLTMILTDCLCHMQSIDCTTKLDDREFLDNEMSLFV